MPNSSLALIQNIGGGEILIILAVMFLGYGLSIICLIHCAMNKRMNGAAKGIWILEVFLIPVFGPIAYFLGGRKT